MWGRRMLTAAVAAGAMVGVSPAPAWAGWEIGAAVAVSEPRPVARTFEGPAAAIDPTDDRFVLVAAADIVSSRCHLYRSADRGRSFASLEGPDFGAARDCGLNRGGLPQNLRMALSFDPEGVLYWAVAVADPAQGGARAVVLARSPDRGETWTTTVVTPARAPATPEEAVANFVPDLFVSPFGSAPRPVWVSWRRSFTDASERTTEGWAAKSTDGGATFGPERRAIEKNPGFDAPRVVQDAAGTVYWFQRERPPSGDEGDPPSVSPLLMARSTDGGDTWRQLDIGQADVVMEEPLAAVSPSGDALYLAWADGRHGDLDVFFSRSTDGGDSWSTPLRVNDDPAAGQRTQKWPRMRVAPNGRIDVAWYDYRHDDQETPADDVEFYLGDANDVYLASSEDGGRTFGPNRRMTAASIDRTLGTYNVQYFVEVPPALAAADDVAFVGWSDTRLGSPDTGAQDIFGAVAVADDGGSSVVRFVLIAGIVLGVVGIGLLLAAAARRRRARPPSVPAGAAP